MSKLTIFTFIFSLVFNIKFSQSDHGIAQEKEVSLENLDEQINVGNDFSNDSVWHERANLNDTPSILGKVGSKTQHRDSIGPQTPCPCLLHYWVKYMLKKMMTMVIVAKKISL